MENKNVTVGIIIVLAAGVAFSLLFGWPGFLKKGGPLGSGQTESPSGSEPTASGTTASPTPTKRPSAKPTTALSYTEAVNQYINRRLQFDPNCVVIPNYVVFKKGTQIMLDNRSGQARPVFLDGQRYNLEAYGFRIITLTTTASLPHTIKVDCGTGKNNGQIILQQ